MPLPELHPKLEAALRARGVESVFAHQAESLAAARRGEHVVVATGTASGKTLAFNLPVLDALAAEPKLRALYLYPTKALAQDQARSLTELGVAGVNQDVLRRQPASEQGHGAVAAAAGEPVDEVQAAADPSAVDGPDAEYAGRPAQWDPAWEDAWSDAAGYDGWYDVAGRQFAGRAANGADGRYAGNRVGRAAVACLGRHAGPRAASRAFGNHHEVVRRGARYAARRRLDLDI